MKKTILIGVSIATVAAILLAAAALGFAGSSTKFNAFADAKANEQVTDKTAQVATPTPTPVPAQEETPEEAMRWLFDRNILENESRAAIFRYIKENPETYPQKIVHATNIGRGAVLYHLDILLYAGMVACLKDGKLRKYRAAQKAVIDAGARWTIGGEKLNSKAIMQ